MGVGVRLQVAHSPTKIFGPLRSVFVVVPRFREHALLALVIVIIDDVRGMPLTGMVAITCMLGYFALIALKGAGYPCRARTAPHFVSVLRSRTQSFPYLPERKDPDPALAYSEPVYREFGLTAIQ